jgi:hypothetical protein
VGERWGEKWSLSLRVAAEIKVGGEKLAAELKLRGGQVSSTSAITFLKQWEDFAHGVQTYNDFQCLWGQKGAELCQG